MSVPRAAAALLVLGALSAACSVGQGDGSLQSEMLFVEGCWEGDFDLRPTFFAANPFDDTLTIRIQRGERDIGVSDGFTMLVYDVPGIRRSGLGQELPVGLPVGVSPLGFPLPPVPDPPAASFSLYLNNSCRSQNAQLLAVSGTVIFDKLFSGDANEENSDDRLTEGRFEVTVVDPRDARIVEGPGGQMTYEYPPERRSFLQGHFDFVFHRGTPAQPFP